MQTSFDIILSRPLSDGDLVAAIEELVPAGLRIIVGSDIADLSHKGASFWSVVRTSDDPAWPCVLDVFGCGDELQLGSFPDLRIAARLAERFGVDVLCGTYPFVGTLDPHDPYWSLAHVNGRWYLASTVATKLMDDDGTGAVKLIREIDVPAA